MNIQWGYLLVIFGIMALFMLFSAWNAGVFDRRPGGFGGGSFFSSGSNFSDESSSWEDVREWDSSENHSRLK